MFRSASLVVCAGALLALSFGCQQAFASPGAPVPPPQGHASPAPKPVAPVPPAAGHAAPAPMAHQPVQAVAQPGPAAIPGRPAPKGRVVHPEPQHAKHHPGDRRQPPKKVHHSKHPKHHRAPKSHR